MESYTTYEKNLSALLSTNPLLATTLFSLTTNSSFSVFQGKDPLDINIINNTDHRYLYENPVADVESKINEIEREYSRYAVLFFYGLGNGILY
ncbi:MAG: motility accessory factor, partial [Sulfuricurvum sp.]|nr:motility accessory factor [Sulfuricurvum sp.]